MGTQFSNLDSKRPQRLAIDWSMELPRDDSAGPPDEMQDGFWPSLDSDNDGYIGGPNEGESPADYQARFKKAERSARGIMSSWKADKWHYVGVVARAVVLIPIGGNSFRCMTLESAGLWGIESSSGKYLRDVYAEQKADLLGELQTMATALLAGDFVQEESGS